MRVQCEAQTPRRKKIDVAHQWRVVDLTTKQGAARELTQAVNDKVRPILEKQTGFVDVIIIVSDTEPTRVLALSFWNTREDVQRYEREQFDAVHKTLQHILETAPVVRTFAVHTSTTHRIAAGKAA